MTDMIYDLGNPDCYIFDREEVECLLQGNFRSRKCLTCDGTGYEHAQDGEVIGTGYKKDIDLDIEPYMCEDCNGFGQIIKLGEK